MKTRSAFSRTEWVVGSLAILALGLTMSAAFGNPITRRMNQTKAYSNCRQIILAMRIYAADHQGVYPDAAANAKTANEAFRQLFKDQVLDSEAIFGCPESMFVPDNVIGKAPDFSDAVKPGENHWAMTADITDSSSGSTPLIYENPAKAEWPAKWQPSGGPARSKGQAWEDNSIVVGLNDGSAQAMKLLPG
ncbi:MAG TPA: hypothetical protein VLE43_09855, partial [Candidatus Saccharimonadia bacterium]|nr:hypothetical protein [Candidatus Saccharimonadia bacterium]